MTISSLLLIGIVSTLSGVLFSGWFLFRVLAREQHGKITDAENSFWVRRGVIRPATAEKLARFEKSRTMNAIYAIEGVLLLLFGLAALFVYMRPDLLRRDSASASPRRHAVPSSSVEAVGANR